MAGTAVPRPSMTDWPPFDILAHYLWGEVWRIVEMIELVYTIISGPRAAPSICLDTVRDFFGNWWILSLGSVPIRVFLWRLAEYISLLVYAFMYVCIYKYCMCVHVYVLLHALALATIRTGIALHWHVCILE